MSTIEERVEKLLADVEALSEAIQADESDDQSAIRAEMGKLHEQFSALIAKAKAYAAKSQKLFERADEEKDNAENFRDSADELVSSLEGASEAMDPDQWNWGDQEET